METPDQRPPDAPQARPGERYRRLILLVSVLVVAVCGLIYELLSATLSSYLMGDSVFQFSIVIGLFLSGMGLGAFLSKLVQRRLLTAFVWVEIGVAILGGFSGLLLFCAFTYGWNFWLVLIINSVGVGTLVGMEVPIILRLVQEEQDLPASVGNVLGFDYIGSLVAAVLFPVVLVPRLGLMRTAFAFGLLNLFVAWGGFWLFRRQLKQRSQLLAALIVATLALSAGVIGSSRLTSALEEDMYQDEIVFTRSTAYQRIVITRFRNDLRLYLNGNIQFSSVDEHRYHESLVHPVVAASKRAERVLILGGGDGMALRELFKHKQVKHVDLVDIDPTVVNIFRAHPLLLRLNRRSLRDPRVRIHHEDALRFVRRTRQRYDLIIVDLPDPATLSLGKLYSLQFFRLLARRLRDGGALGLQATSPVFARRTYWCIVHTLRKAGFHTYPYHVNVPSFSEWGFVLATAKPLSPAALRLPWPGRFLTEAVLPTLFVFPPDIGPLPTQINHLDNQIVVKYFNDDARKWNR